MTHLQKITTLAKKIRKQYPNKKWTDFVKAASNELKAGKKVAGYTGTRRDGNKTTVFYTTKKTTAKPKQGKLFGEKHTDTKSHNVRISIGKKINGIPMIKLTKDSFTRVNNDTSGNPRYAIHFLDILNNEEKNSSSTLDSKYNLALKKAKKINGKKYHNKLYGGGIVFQSYNLDSLIQRIKDII